MTMAPACPIFLPGGAAPPAMKATMVATMMMKMVATPGAVVKAAGELVKAARAAITLAAGAALLQVDLSAITSMMATMMATLMATMIAAMMAVMNHLGPGAALS